MKKYEEKTIKKYEEKHHGDFLNHPDSYFDWIGKVHFEYPMKTRYTEMYV